MMHFLRSCQLMFDVRAAIQKFWDIVQNVRCSKVYTDTKFTKDEMLNWRNQPIILKIAIKDKGTVLVGGRGAIEFVPTSPGIGGLDVFTDHAEEDVQLELQIINDHLVLTDINTVIIEICNSWPATSVCFE